MFVKFMVELTGAEVPEDLEKLKWMIAGGIMDGESMNVAVLRELEEMFPWMINLICQVRSVVGWGVSACRF
jgi:ribosome biogenesis SPOUT family RNA methylase Rps3